MTSRVLGHFCYMILIFTICALISLQGFMLTPFFSNPYYEYIHGEVDEGYPVFTNSVGAKGQANIFFEFLNSDDIEINNLSFYTLLSKDEKIHWVDVKELYKKTSSIVIQLLTCFLFLLVLFLKGRNIRKYYFHFSMKHHLSFFGIIFAMGVVGLLFFNSLWRFAHTLVFSNTSWSLPYDTITIQTFPLSYFVYSIVSVGLLSLSVYIFFFVVVSRLRQQRKRTPESQN